MLRAIFQLPWMILKGLELRCPLSPVPALSAHFPWKYNTETSPDPLLCSTNQLEQYTQRPHPKYISFFLYIPSLYPYTEWLV